MSASVVTPRHRPAAAAVRTARGGSLIAMPRAAALLCAVLASGAATTSLLVAGNPRLYLVSLVPVVLPLVAAASAVGVGRLASWIPQAWSEWRGPLGYATLAPWAALMFLAAAVPTLGLPWWAALAAGASTGVPFLWSALGPNRLRGVVRPRPDAHGRRGGLVAALALLVTAYSVLRPDYGSVLAVATLAALSLAAFATRGLADAGQTWGFRQWLGLATGAFVIWGAVLVSSLTPLLERPWAHLLVVCAAALPLALASGGPRAPRKPAPGVAGAPTASEG